MAKKKASQDEPAKRLQAILRGAFAHSPTPLKRIPKLNGEPRRSLAKSAPRDRPTGKRERGK